MPAPDDFLSYIGELLRGSYDCVDRIVLRAYYPMGQTSGGFLLWWNELNPNTALSQEHLRRMAGDFSRRVRAFGRAVAEAVIALAPQPDGFTAEELATRVRTQQGRTMAKYNARKAAYDLRKLRGKALVQRIAKTRRYRVRRPGIRTLAALLILREKVLKPVLAGVCRPKRGRPPKTIHPLD